MGTRGVAVPPDILEAMRRHAEVNWSAVAVAAFLATLEGLGWTPDEPAKEPS